MVVRLGLWRMTSLTVNDIPYRLPCHSLPPSLVQIREICGVWLLRIPAFPAHPLIHPFRTPAHFPALSLKDFEVNERSGKSSSAGTQNRHTPFQNLFKIFRAVYNFKNPEVCSVCNAAAVLFAVPA